MISRITLHLLLLFTVISCHIYGHDFSTIDKYASSEISSKCLSINELGNHLLKECNTDMEKARAIYVWLTTNVSYDIKGLKTNNSKSCDAYHVYYRRKTVCEGFANLFYELGKHMGLNIIKIHGYAKGLDYSKGQKFHDSNHAWNAIKIDKTWRLFDATWGEGYANISKNKNTSTKQFTDLWFDVDPYIAIFSHYPKDTNFLLIEPTLTLREFESLPYINSAYFDYGFEGERIYKRHMNNEPLYFPTVYNVEANIKMIKAPASRYLKNKSDYTFTISAPKVYEITLKDATGKWHTFTKKGDIFHLSLKITGLGTVCILLKDNKRDKRYNTIIEYKSVRQLH